MILTRLTRAIREQNWFAVTLEFLIVIAGVVIGFQITAWREDVSQREMGRDYVERIVEELRANQIRMRDHIAYMEWVEAHTIQAIRAIEDNEGTLGPDFIVDTYIAAHGTNTIIRRDSFDELLSTGSLRTISDADVRQGLIGFYAETDFAQPILQIQSDFQSRYRQAMPHETISDLRQACAPMFNEETRDSLMFSVPGTCPPTLSDRQVSEAVDSLLAANLLPLLRESLAEIEIKQNYCLRIDNSVSRTLALIERHMD